MSILENPYRPLPLQCRTCSPRPASTYRVGWDADSTNHAPPSPSADRHHHRRRQRRRCRSPPPTTSSARGLSRADHGVAYCVLAAVDSTDTSMATVAEAAGRERSASTVVMAVAAARRCARPQPHVGGGVVGGRVDDDDGSRVALGRCAVPAVAKGYGAARCRVVLAATMAARCYAAANPMTSAYHQSVEC